MPWIFTLGSCALSWNDGRVSGQTMQVSVGGRMGVQERWGAAYHPMKRLRVSMTAMGRVLPRVEESSALSLAFGS